MPAAGSGGSAWCFAAGSRRLLTAGTEEEEAQKGLGLGQRALVLALSHTREEAAGAFKLWKREGGLGLERRTGGGGDRLRESSVRFVQRRGATEASICPSAASSRTTIPPPIHELRAVRQPLGRHGLGVRRCGQGHQIIEGFAVARPQPKRLPAPLPS